ncbi:T9SS sorting signal type C domain-containing protein [Flavobacterium haoranii]|uniref:Por secretion system C-terminal sorting domain-containing protein n=1 Tax=Flavobacterium haoranii TaxID=683124 RepID=A0A1M6DKW1_9FLAO|nr:T9SS sorting signal type C domain-containing protein [Flavobacterium haoranii]SHI73855.1 hypothetical protein SAMN05444337_0676 [Flavobacterium haoranii]
MEGATNAVDNAIDGKILDDTKPMIYSVLNNEAYVIQGRALPFNDTDVVALGFKALEKGTYVINLDNVDGVFSAQDIFIKDKFIGTTHNLKESGYSFISEAGDFKNRFELVYKKASTEIVSNENEVLVFKNNGQIVINSTSEKIANIQVFDIQGKILFQENLKANEYRVKGLTVSNQALIVKIQLSNGEKVAKKIIF